MRDTIRAVLYASALAVALAVTWSVAGTRGPSAPRVVEVAVWPYDLDLADGDSAQVYAALLYSDGRVHCAAPPPNPAFRYSIGPAGCDSAVARLRLRRPPDEARSRSSPRAAAPL
jgi:hypothetical protein